LFIRWLAPPHNRPFAELVVLFMMFEPVTLLVVRQAWTEPIVLAFWAASMLATQKALAQSKGQKHDRLQTIAGVALGLLAAIKQYSPIMLIPPLLQTAFLKRPKRQLLIAVTAAAITVVPFLFWNPAEFLRDVVFLQFRQPFRLDSLSLPAAIARLRNDPELPALAFLPAFLAPFLLFMLAKPLPGRMDQIASTTAAGFIVFIFLNKQSFCNYYWLALGLIGAACALSESTPSCMAPTLVEYGSTATLLASKLPGAHRLNPRLMTGHATAAEVRCFGISPFSRTCTR
jgi:4-amino-4-deoxy-L-arabinose transferase-like glycosyltransferase